MHQIKHMAEGAPEFIAREEVRSNGHRLSPGGTTRFARHQLPKSKYVRGEGLFKR